MIDIKRIMCPVDFSEFSHHALVHAAALARWYAAPLTIVHVHPLGVPPWALAPGAAPASADVLRLAPVDRAQLTAELERFAATAGTPGTTGLNVDFVVEEGDVPHGIVAAAESAMAGMIVLGTHGRSGVARVVLGSVTENVLHLASRPVLTVPPRTPPGGDVAKLFEHVLVATDFSAAGQASLDYALSLAQETNSRLTVLHVVEPPRTRDEDEWVTRSGGMDSLLEQMKASASRELAQSVPAPARDWCRVTERVEIGRSHREILRVAEQEQAGLIVLGAHGSGVLERMFVGSTAHHVMRRASCPVLAVRPRQA